jgi:hypothetical protein
VAAGIPLKLASLSETVHFTGNGNIDSETEMHRTYEPPNLDRERVIRGLLGSFIGLGGQALVVDCPSKGVGTYLILLRRKAIL